MKTIFATVGIIVLVLGIVVWQFGFFYNQVSDVKKTIDRTTAVSRAQAMIDKTKQQADSLSARSREMKIKARTTELSVEREQEELSKTEFAIKQMAQTLKAANLPKPSEMGMLTDEQKTAKIVFAGKEGTAMDAYNQIFKWEAEYKQKKSVLDAKRKLIDTQNAMADKMLVKKQEMKGVIDKIEIQLAQLKAGREMAEIEAEMAKLGATVEGVNVGDIGQVLDTIQSEIDELNATTEVVNTEVGKPSDGEVFSKPVAVPTADGNNTLDALWD